MSEHAPCTIAWLPPVAAAVAAGETAVLIVVAAVQGSAPRETGAAMVVTASACTGSIGGGHLEFEALRVAREALDHGTGGTWTVRFPLAARLGQCCGGVATLAFSRIDRDARAWLDAAVACERTGASFALLSCVGEAPGTQLVVTADDARGSLGSADLDSAAVALARTRLAGGAQGPALVPFAANEGATLLLQVQRPDAFPVLVFGNGHVGRALVHVLAVLPAQVRWIDSREADFPEDVPANTRVVVTDSPEDEIDDAPAGSFVVVATHSHPLDFALIECALARDDWAYLGLIGSRSKRAQFERRMAARGARLEALARVQCPIGTSAVKLAGKHPGTIAVAIAVELLAVRERGQHANAPRGVALLRPA
ncbi:MAG TPA: xanthine dehydrogenase accessory protein XdhC [Casimicrobiaceae bacterium]|nr:xanthine dehydrogenase accessory protein XdhC [Casimicrobiaceae bacterium]